MYIGQKNKQNRTAFSIGYISVPYTFSGKHCYWLPKKVTPSNRSPYSTLLYPTLPYPTLPYLGRVRQGKPYPFTSALLPVPETLQGTAGYLSQIPVSWLAPHPPFFSIKLLGSLSMQTIVVLFSGPLASLPTTAIWDPSVVTIHTTVTITFR